jgi:retron-type reverse transcriptase
MIKEENNKSINEWQDYLSDRGLSEDLILKYIPYIKKLNKNKTPVIFEVEHLSALIGIEYLELNKIIHNPECFYRDFTIPKRNGGKRIISAPYPSLLKCQHWIYENILKKQKIHSCAHAYEKNKSILTNAESHLNKKALLKMDMKNFFPSIPINWVINFFSQLGYANNVSYTLATICCLNSALPQGAPTSPSLSNILLWHFDRRVYNLSNTYNLNYTRYADDLTFSGYYIPHKFILLISSITENCGLSINEKKTKLIIGSKQKIVTGISVKNDVLTLPRKSKRLIKQEIHYIKKYGLISHISKLKIKKTNYLLSLEGKIRFWLQVEPDNIFANESLLFILNNK